VNVNYRGASNWARLVCGLEVVLLAALVGLVLLLEIGPYSPPGSVAKIALDLASGSSAVLVGAVVTLKRPQNLVGWALLLVGAGFLLSDLLDAYAQLALLDPQYSGLPAGAAAEAASGGAWTMLMAGVFMLLVVFPSGVVGSRAAGRWLRAVVAGFAAVWFVITTAPGKFDSPFQRFHNPLAFVNDRHYFLPAIPIIVGCLLSVLWAAILAVRRFRRSRGQERQQFKWLAASALLLLVTFPVAAAFNSSYYAGIPFSFALVTLPVSVGLAVLRYRLYEIDKLISRTISYAILTGLLVALFIGIVALATDVLPFSSPVAVAASTLAAAALFNPLRRRIQHAVDRRFNRARYDAEAIVATFTLGLRDAVDLDTIRQELLRAVDGAVQPAYASVWLRPPAQRSRA
jgi:peptidoglycan/LPS O-acetylase OafA/YrhL